jgi:hypothetical protein
MTDSQDSSGSIVVSPTEINARRGCQCGWLLCDGYVRVCALLILWRCHHSNASVRSSWVERFDRCRWRRLLSLSPFSFPAHIASIWRRPRRTLTSHLSPRVFSPSFLLRPQVNRLWYKLAELAWIPLCVWTSSRAASRRRGSRVYSFIAKHAVLASLLARGPNAVVTAFLYCLWI